MGDNEERIRAEKRARSEAKRLEAIRNKAELTASRDRVVGLALKDVDIEKKRKKITFDSESEDEDETKQVATKKRKMEENGRASKGKNKGEKLFGSDDDEEEEEQEIVFQNRHKGEKGIKLMQQEARYGNDQRFKLNEKFEDSDEDAEKEDDMDEEEKELKGEKEGALSVLARVLGKEINREKSKKDKKSKARPFTRFDPDNEEHVRWMMENAKKREYVEEDTEEKEGKERHEEGDNDEQPSVYKKIAVEGRFFEMGGDFAKELKEKLEGKKTDEPFSFLASIGREEKKVVNTIVMEKEEDEKKGDVQQIMRLDKETDPMGFDTTPSIGFFFDVFSASARSVVSNFRRTQSLEKVKEKWSEQRESIIKTYKNQRRFAVKNARDEKKGYEKKEGGMFKKNEEEEENGKKDNREKKDKTKIYPMKNGIKTQ